MDYNKYSRKGLVKLAEDFDKENSNELSSFVEAKEKIEGVTYPLVKPFYIRLERVEDIFNNTSNKVVNKVDNSIDKTARIVDSALRVIDACDS